MQKRFGKLLHWKTPKTFSLRVLANGVDVQPSLSLHVC